MIHDGIDVNYNKKWDVDMLYQAELAEHIRK
jgi:hypothetical protein